jgi:hypothetical protein
MHASNVDSLSYILLVVVMTVITAQTQTANHHTRLTAFTEVSVRVHVCVHVAHRCKYKSTFTSQYLW